ARRRAGGLFFATSQALEDRVRELLADGAVGAVVLDLESVNYIDSQGAAQLAAILDLVEAAGATLRLDRVKPGVREVLRADGFAERVPIAEWQAAPAWPARARRARRWGGGRRASQA